MSAPEVTRFWLIRHGRVAREWHGRIYGALDVPLSELGEGQMRAAAERLAAERVDAVVSSGLARTEFGAALLRAPRGLARRDEPDLRELDRGEWAGLWKHELDARDPGAWERWWTDPAGTRPPNGESLTDLGERVLGCLNRLAREHAGGRVAVVAHSWVIRAVAGASLGLPIGATVRLDLPPGSLTAVDWPVGGLGGGGNGGAAEGGGAGAPHPTLVGFNADRAPDAGRVWRRGRNRCVEP